MSAHVVLIKSKLGKTGGLEKHALRLASAFRERNCNVTLLTSEPPETKFPIDIISLKALKKPAFLHMESFDKAVRKWLEDHPARVIFGLERGRFQTHLRAGTGVHAAYLERRRELESRWKRFSFALNPLHRKILSLEKEAFENPHLKRVFANSHMVKEEILRFYRIDPEKIAVIHNGVEWKEMQEPFSLWPEKKREDSLFHFLFIGNGYRRKGLNLLLLALQKLPTRRFLLSVLGKDKNLLDYVDLSKRLGLEKNVRFLGEQNPLPFYQEADALVIPSWYDPFANVTVEALAMGVQVISSKYNGGHEILTEENGHIIPNLHDTDSFAAVLEKALRSPKTLSSSSRIRGSVSSLDFSLQMKKLIDDCLL